MQEDTVKDSNETEDKARTIAYSMKLVNGVYSKLIEVFAMQIREEDGEDYTRGWNDAFSTVVQMTQACKYTAADFKEMMNEKSGNPV